MRKTAFMFVTLMVISLCAHTACEQPERPLTAASLLDFGEKYLLEMDYEQAIVEFTKVIGIDPRNVRAYVGRADAYMGLARHNEAVQDYEQAIVINSNLVEAYLKLAESYLVLGDDDKAREVLERGRNVTADAVISAKLEELLMRPHLFSETNEKGETVVVFGQTDLNGRKQGFCIVNVFKQDTSELVYMEEGEFVDDQPNGMRKNWWFIDTNINEQFGVENGCGRGVGEHKDGKGNGFITVECYIGYSISEMKEGEMVRFDDCFGERMVYCYKGNMVNGEAEDDSGNAYQMYISRNEDHYGDKVEFIGQFKNGHKDGYVKRWREGMLEYEGYWSEPNGPTGEGQWYDIGR